ncbi:hypothetical protein D3C80_1101680 [compost metagenome]
MLGSKVADNPNSSGHCEIAPPDPALYSASLFAPFLGSELLLAGIPTPMPSTKAWMLLFHSAATIGLSTEVISTCRKLSFVKNAIC